MLCSLSSLATCVHVAMQLGTHYYARNVLRLIFLVLIYVMSTLVALLRFMQSYVLLLLMSLCTSVYLSPRTYYRKDSYYLSQLSIAICYRASFYISSCSLSLCPILSMLVLFQLFLGILSYSQWVFSYNSVRYSQQFPILPIDYLLLLIFVASLWITLSPIDYLQCLIALATRTLRYVVIGGVSNSFSRSLPLVTLYTPITLYRWLF